MEIRITGARRRLEAMQTKLAKHFGVVGRLYPSRDGKDVRLYLRVEDDAVDAVVEHLAAPGGAPGRDSL